MRKRNRKLTIPPIKLAVIAIPKALPASPRAARGYPSIAVAEAEGVPGMLRSIAEKLPPVMPPTYSPSKRAIEMSAGKTKVMGRRTMIPVLMVRPGIIPTIKPIRTPMQEENRTIIPVD
tara:strand:+ start:84 stop:440 length:357 start_codon:yes stop_codon:yes gene_type:complete